MLILFRRGDSIGHGRLNLQDLLTPHPVLLMKKRDHLARGRQDLRNESLLGDDDPEAETVALHQEVIEGHLIGIEETGLRHHVDDHLRGIWIDVKEIIHDHGTEEDRR